MPKKKSDPTKAKKVVDKLAKLKPRQRKYVEERAKGKDKLNAAIAAGYSKTTARIAGEKIENRQPVREAFQALVQEMIKPQKVVQRISEGLDATKYESSTVNEWVPVPTADGKGTVLKKQSRTEVTELTDYGERRKYAELVAKFGGFYNEKLQVEGAGDVDVRFHLVGGD